MLPSAMRDQGGNHVYVRFFGADSNLQQGVGYWLIMHTVYPGVRTQAGLKINGFPGRDLTGLDGGTPADWAIEAHKFAHDVAYDLPAATT